MINLCLVVIATQFSGIYMIENTNFQSKFKSTKIEAYLLLNYIEKIRILGKGRRHSCRPGLRYPVFDNSEKNLYYVTHLFAETKRRETAKMKVRVSFSAILHDISKVIKIGSSSYFHMLFL